MFSVKILRKIDFSIWFIVYFYNNNDWLCKNNVPVFELYMFIVLIITESHILLRLETGLLAEERQLQKSNFITTKL